MLRKALWLQLPKDELIGLNLSLELPPQLPEGRNIRSRRNSAERARMSSLYVGNLGLNLPAGSLSTSTAQHHRDWISGHHINSESVFRQKNVESGVCLIE